MTRVFSILGISLLAFILIELFVGILTTSFLSKADGSIVRKIILFSPIFTSNPLEIVVSAEYRETAYSRFFAEVGSFDELHHEWTPIGGGHTRSLFAIFLDLSLRPNFDLHFPFGEHDQVILYEFLLHKHESDDSFEENLKDFFANFPASLKRDFRKKTSEEYIEWRKHRELKDA